MELFKNSKFLKSKNQQSTRSLKKIESSLRKINEEKNSNLKPKLNHKKYIQFENTPLKLKKKENIKKNLTQITYSDKHNTFLVNDSSLLKNSSVPNLLNNTNVEQDISSAGGSNIKKFILKNRVLSISNSKKNLVDNKFQRLNQISNRSNSLKNLNIDSSKSPIVTFEDHLKKLLAEKEDYITKIKNKKKLLKARYKYLEVEYKKLLDKYKDYPQDQKDKFNKISSYERDIKLDERFQKMDNIKIPTLINQREDKENKKILNFTNNLSSNNNTSTSVSNKYKSFNSFTERKLNDNKMNFLRNDSGFLQKNHESKRSSSVLESTKQIFESFNNFKTLEIKEKILENLNYTYQNNQEFHTEICATRKNNIKTIYQCELVNLKQRTVLILDKYLSIAQNRIISQKGAL